MAELTSVEVKAFVPARDFERSKQFYQDLGFTLASDMEGLAYFKHGSTAFLLQNFYVKEHAENFMMHLLVEDVDGWWNAITSRGVAEKYGVRLT
ncbi:MAG: VOC family protein, partial [Myxococcota bacterium]